MIVEKVVKVNRCVFVEDWICPVDGDEIPLEICQVCVRARTEARKSRNSLRTVSRRRRMRSSWREELSELDKQFVNGQLHLQEYIQRRKEIIESIAT
ncbi:hypothetical protein DRO58_07955 [Candidatus Bathyarchaeota archaeon]|nr:MAG: hypothetical protein DRO58_07955 [Candidatus Bathyarchaeota archaeon]